MAGTGARGTRTRVTGWVGWIWFAGLLMMLNGGFNAIDGLVALLKNEVYVQTKNHLILFDYTGWGWIMLIIGAIQILVGVALLYGAYWARIAAIVIVCLSALAQITFITAYPLWSMAVIAIDVLVLWALTVHGGEAEELIS
jgi:hypothetical protein